MVKLNNITKEEAVEKLNAYDNTVTLIMLRSEQKNCKKKGKELWTPEIQQSNLRIQYYHIHLLSERQRIWSGKRLDDIKSRMDTESINMIESNKKTLEGSTTSSIKRT
jgi:hypothetical protein